MLFKRRSTVWYVQEEAGDEVIAAEIDLDEPVVDSRVQVDARTGIAVHNQIGPVMVDDARRSHGFLIRQVINWRAKRKKERKRTCIVDWRKYPSLSLHVNRSFYRSWGGRKDSPQRGRLPDHIPSFWQVRTESPSKAKPGRQLCAMPNGLIYNNISQQKKERNENTCIRSSGPGCRRPPSRATLASRSRPVRALRTLSLPHLLK